MCPKIEEVDGWTSEWPTEPGFYWVYGYFYKTEKRISLCTAEVWKIPKGTTVVREGNFYFESEAGHVLWKRLPEPDKATLETLDKLLKP